MAGSSNSNSSGTSTSTSTPTVVQTPQSEWALQLSQLLGALTQNQYSWAMDQFNKGSGVTDANINNYMQLAGMGAGLAQNLLGRYENVFEPLMNNFIQQAGSYNSADRQHFMMGQAESTAAQADKAAMDSAQRNLQGFGINPNSGRYQDLLLTSRMQDAATRAGAGTQASVNTAAIGRQMEQQAVQMGQNVPGMTVNALQSAYTGVTGAENAILGLLNTGANLTNTAANFGNAAGNANKLPPVGQNSNSQSQNRGQSSSQQQDPNNKNQNKQQQPTSGNRGGNGTGPGGNPLGGGNGVDTSKTITRDTSNDADYATAGGLGVDTNPNNLPAWLANPTLNDHPDAAGQPGQATSPDNTNWADPSGGQKFPIGTGQGPGTNPQGVAPNDMFQPSNTGNNAFADAPTSYSPNGNTFGQSFNPGQPFDASQFGPGAWDPSPQQGQYGGQGGDYSQPQSQDQGQYVPQADQQGNYGGGGQGGGQQSQGTYGGQGGNYGPQPDVGQYQAPAQSDYSGGQGNYGGSQGSYQGNYGGSYARGGQVGMIPTTGGPVPRSASPSRGRQTDDISARLNAGEFVIPRDVTQHFGTKHFQDLIAKSRKLRTGMAGPPARPKMRPPLSSGPSFVSQNMGR